MVNQCMDLARPSDAQDASTPAVSASELHVIPIFAAILHPPPLLMAVIANIKIVLFHNRLEFGFGRGPSLANVSPEISSMHNYC